MSRGPGWTQRALASELTDELQTLGDLAHAVGVSYGGQVSRALRKLDLPLCWHFIRDDGQNVCRLRAVHLATECDLDILV